jgi:hypothetical protein
MKISIAVTNYSWSTDPDQLTRALVRCARQADGTGIDTLWVADHLLQMEPGADVDEPMLEAYTTLGFLGAATQRLRLGTMVTWASLRPPALLVKTVTTLVAHIVGAGAWIGIDVIVGVLVVTGWFGGDAGIRSLAYRALASFVVWPMLVAGLLSLATGLVLGLGTHWGLFRVWWVAVKLALNVVLCTLIVLVLQPGMAAVADYGEHLLTGSPDRGAVATLFFPPAVSLTALSLATVLAVVRPWGRIRGRRTPRTS